MSELTPYQRECNRNGSNSDYNVFLKERCDRYHDALVEICDDPPLCGEGCAQIAEKALYNPPEGK